MTKQTADEVKQRIELMKQFYYKGFGYTITQVRDSADFFVDSPDERNEIKEHMLSHLSEIENFYKKLPLDKLNNMSDFAPLFVVKKLLPEYRERAENILKNPDEKELKEIYSLCTTITIVGEVF